MFHLLAHTDGSGGKSLLVDGFAAATELYKTDREAYNVLGTVGVRWHASGNEDVSIQPDTAHPVLNHDPYDGHLMQIRWNNADRASLTISQWRSEQWYVAAE